MTEYNMGESLWLIKRVMEEEEREGILPKWRWQVAGQICVSVLGTGQAYGYKDANRPEATIFVPGCNLFASFEEAESHCSKLNDAIIADEQRGSSHA